ncbi:MAG: hypothetical protein V1746_04875 [bacterium]
MNDSIFNKINPETLQPVKGKPGTFEQLNPDGSKITLILGRPFKSLVNEDAHFFSVEAYHTGVSDGLAVAELKACNRKEIDQRFPGIFASEHNFNNWVESLICPIGAK